MTKAETGSSDDDAAWVEQGCITVYARLKPGAESALLATLTDIGARVAATGEPFARSPRIHYARFVFIPGVADPAGGNVPSSVMYLADFDGSLDAHLDEISEIAAAELDRIGVCCEDPLDAAANGRCEWLRRHVIPDAIHYVNTIGRTVGQIRSEAKLREAIEEFIDRENPQATAARIREFVHGRPDLQWALEPPPSDRTWGTKRTFARIAGIVIAIPVVLILLPVLLIWALILRLHEKRDDGNPPRPDPAHVTELAAVEDRTLQNQFSALGFAKPGWFRLVTAIVILRIGRFGARYFFDRETIGGVKTIHFARWTFIDGKRRMLFVSNYDGSLENYMGDFIDIVAWGLNAIFSNGLGYPRTRFLIIDGAWEEGAFKRHIRNRQITTQVWYSAYPNLSALNIAENARIRAGVAGIGPEGEGKDWLRLLRRNWGRPHPTPVNLEREDMQGLIVRGHSSHPAACFLLLSFASGDEGQAAARRWLSALDVNNGTSDRDDSYLHVAFTRRGLERLGCPQAIVEGFSNEFRFGMTTPHRRRILGDDGGSAPERWNWGRENEPLDSLLLLYARTDGELARFCAKLRADFTRFGVVELKRLDTSTLRLEGDRFGREHFGFNDGLTTPPIEGLSKQGPTGQSIKPGEFILGYENEYGRHTARPLVSPDLDPRGLLKADVEGSGAVDFGRNGTYLVFRQLHQDVHRFWSVVDAAAWRNGADPETKRVWLAAKMVGRWPSGAPMTLARERDDPGLAVTDFMFHGADRRGHGCPVGSHIRRTNPRDSLDPAPGSAESLSVNKRHRLLRRGRTYGPPLAASLSPGDFLAAGDDGVERGLHFICLAANIARQFEFIQASWVNNPQFGELLDDVDPLIGRRGRFMREAPEGATTRFTIPGAGGQLCLRDLPDFVTVRGGAYFFMPGMSALKYLATETQ